MAISAFPRWLLGRITQEELGLVDWGCAEGDALGFFCRHIPATQLRGVDFSQVAIDLARPKYPHIHFDCEDWLGSDTTSEPKDCDVLFSSNTLEHFHDPRVALQILAAHARRYLVLMLPYREDPTIDEHFFSFFPDNIPAAIRPSFSLAYARVINCARLQPTFWAGEQILLVYASNDELPFLARLPIRDRRIELEDVAWLLGERELAAALRREVEQTREAIARDAEQLEAARSEREEAVVHHKKIAELQTALEQASDERAHTRQELDSARIENEGQVTRLRAKIAQLQSELARASADSAQTRKELDFERIKKEEELARLTINFQERDATCLALAHEIEAKHDEYCLSIKSLEQSLLDRELQLAQSSDLFRKLRDEASAQRDRDALTVAELERQACGLARALAERTRAARTADVYPDLTTGANEPHLSLDKLASTTRNLNIVLKLLEDLGGGQVLLVFGMNDWRFRTQRPQHLSTELARSGQTVVYVSPTFIDSLSPGYSLARIERNLYDVRLHCFSAHPIHEGAPEQHRVMQLVAGLNFLLDACVPNGFVSLLQHPFWYPTAGALTPPSELLIYERFDNVRGFPRTPGSVVALEDRLIANADLLICSSLNLVESTATATRNPCFLVRNGCDFPHFNTAAASGSTRSGRRIIGYFGAIEDWFDTDLVARLALEIPDATITLIGQDQIAAAERLRGVQNVELVGEVPYADLPLQLRNFDVCIIPFILNDLTVATDPIKVYEYLASGKPVVATALPELAPYSGMVYIAESHDRFVAMVLDALLEDQNEPIRQQRIEFAQKNSWSDRATAMRRIVRQFV